MNDLFNSETHVLYPLAHFRQILNQKIFDIFVYPLCEDGDLEEYSNKHSVKGQTLKSIFLQMAERNV